MALICRQFGRRCQVTRWARMLGRERARRLPASERAGYTGTVVPYAAPGAGNSAPRRLSIRSGGSMHTSEVFIGGQWRAPASDETYATINPATEEVSAHVAKGDERDVNLAVQAA